MSDRLPICLAVRGWLAAVRSLPEGVGPAQLDALEQLLTTYPRPRQRLLYLHSREPSVDSPVIAFQRHPSNESEQDQAEMPYPTVGAAIEAGWMVVQVPAAGPAADDVYLDGLGFEFVLEQLDE